MKKCINLQIFFPSEEEGYRALVVSSRLGWPRRRRGKPFFVILPVDFFCNYNKQVIKLFLT